MKISGCKKLFALYKKDLASSKFETLLILGFIAVGNLFLYYKVKTAWTLSMCSGFSVLFLGFVPIFIFFKAFSFIREEWKDNTVYFMMSLPTTGNIIFLSKLLALLTQFFILGITALIFTAGFIPMEIKPQEIWEIIRDFGNMRQVIWELSKAGITLFLSFTMLLITAFFSAVVGKLFKTLSGLITFAVFIVTNIVSTRTIAKITKLIRESRLNLYMQRGMALGKPITLRTLPDSIFVFNIILVIAVSVLLFLATTTIYDKKVEL